MIDDRLAIVTSVLDEWCKSQGIAYDIVCDESDLQGVMLFRKDVAKLSELMSILAPIIQEQGIHAQVQKVRGGNIVAFSIKAISESVMDRIITDAGMKVVGSTFAERVHRAFSITIPDPKPQPEPPEPVDLYASAKKIAEAQYKYATAGSFRNNQSSRQRQAYTSDTTFGGREHPSSPKAKSKRKNTKFQNSLQEALDGIATPTGNQPKELFAKFGRALTTLGTQLGIGPIQDRLREQGIEWKQSDDGQSIIFYVVNATTKAPQPIMRIGSETIDEPHEFQKELTKMLDFAKGNAPGSFQQQQELIQQQEKVVRDVAQAVTPKEQEQSEIQKSMEPEEDAAEIAASPKSSLDLGT